MWVSSVQLHNFRNYEQIAVSFTKGLNLVYGENGRGKTNLVEGIYFLGTLESHRAANNSVLIKAEQPTATVSVTGNFGDRKLVAAAEVNRNSSNRYFLNGSPRKKSTELAGIVKSLIFSPEDLDLVRRDPQDRRSFMDQALVLLKPRLQGVKSDYERVLKQRNALLKSAKQTSKPDLTTLDIWDDQLVALGSELILARLELIKELQPLLADFYRELSGTGEEVLLSLQSSISAEDEEEPEAIETQDLAEIRTMFHVKLQSLRSRELERGITLAGPHRDELFISKSGLAARTQSSQGEAWSIALGLKLALAELIRIDSQSGDPVLILDDVFAVLDAGRRARLVKFVSGFEQVIITSADPASAPDLDWDSELEVGQGGVIEAQL